jgi:hypothetical protein
MPLIQSNLEDALAAFFEDPPETAALCAREWADAMRDYTLPIVPTSTTVAVAAEALAATLTPIFETSLSAPTTASGMEAAWAVFAVTVGSGMLPDWAPTPPPGIVGFLTLFEAPRPLTHREAAANFAQAIHLWMITGLATNTSTSATVSWS